MSHIEQLRHTRVEQIKHMGFADEYKIAVDFDGTICHHTFPGLGEPLPEVFDWLKKFQEAGAWLLLWTMRGKESGRYGDVLTPAIELCRANGVEFMSVNKGIGDERWTTSPKMYANLYIDDAALGCPLIHVPGKRPYVDWSIVGPMVMDILEGFKA